MLLSVNEGILSAGILDKCLSVRMRDATQMHELILQEIREFDGIF